MEGRLRGLAFALGIVSVLIGLGRLYAGVQVLGLRERGRRVGIILAGMGAVASLILLVSAAVIALVAIAVDIFLIWALTRHARSFIR